MSNKLIDKVLNSPEFQALNPDNKTKEDIIYYTCPINYDLPDNQDCNCMPKHWEEHCTECWERSV